MLLFIFVPGILSAAAFSKGSILSVLLMWAPKASSLDFQPSILAIALHFAFATAVLYGSWRLVQQADL